MTAIPIPAQQAEFTPEQVAALAGCSLATVLRAIRRRGLTARRERGHLVIDGESGRAWIEARREKSARAALIMAEQIGFPTQPLYQSTPA
jgi:hypothetical protein